MEDEVEDNEGEEEVMLLHGVEPQGDTLLWPVVAGSCLLDAGAGVSSTPHITEAPEQGASLLCSGSVSEVEVILTEEGIPGLHDSQLSSSWLRDSWRCQCCHNPRSRSLLPTHWPLALSAEATEDTEAGVVNTLTLTQGCYFCRQKLFLPAGW